MKVNDSISCDVLVVGAGSAGLASAVAASRKGAHVIIVEKNGYAGGKATAAYVNTICGLYFRSENPKSRYVADGFMVEFAEKLKFASQTNPQSNKLGLHFLPYSPFKFKVLCDDYFKNEKIELFYHSTISNIHVVDEKMNRVELVSNTNKLTVFFKSIVDTTGEPQLDNLRELPCIESDVYQASAQVFALENVIASSEANLSMVLMKETQKAIMESRLSSDFANCSVVPGSFKDKEVYIKIGIPIEINNRLTNISPVEVVARKMIVEFFTFLKQNSEVFKHSHISDIAPEVGIRTGRRNEGKYILNQQDVLSASKVINSAAKGSWPIEFWEIGKRVKMDYFNMDDYYDIPSDCLVSSRIHNLFFAGRNISATEEAIASARVIGTCLQTGFSAGELAVKNYEI